MTERRLQCEDAPIYLDYQATAPTDPRVVDIMLPFFTSRFGNPHARQHSVGWAAEDAVETARRQVAALIGAKPSEIVFTSGATEANNLAIKGVAGFDPRRDEIVTVVTEHICVLETCARLQAGGMRVTVLPVKVNGLIDLDRLAAALTEKTALVSVMAVNNEIGVIQPLAEIGRMCRQRGILLHSDAAQAAGIIALDVEAMNIDLMSLSGHKLHGPMGIGALYVRQELQRGFSPLFDGGGQERGLRSGTLPLPLCVGFGAACEIASLEMAAEAARVVALRDVMLAGLRRRLPDIQVNGDITARVAGNLNIAFPGVDAEDLMTALPDIAMSSGAACSSASLEPSYVLRALGLDEALARASLRIGLGRFTTARDIDRAVARMADEVERLRDVPNAKSDIELFKSS
ncbi:MAG: aminotransferase class V-fold PLP-dependent enzyme [Rhodopseudomonas sp.]|nr:aminotransferase class V-fold PLP-dependent enzyme [Rhodopseudomonas sp.]